MQYFIWSTDNIGILATEALLRAAGRGVKVRVIVDDLLIDAPDQYVPLTRRGQVRLWQLLPLKPLLQGALDGTMPSAQAVVQRVRGKPCVCPSA